MKSLPFTLIFSVVLGTTPAHAETSRDNLLEIVETMGHSRASKQALLDRRGNTFVQKRVET